MRCYAIRKITSIHGSLLSSLLAHPHSPLVGFLYAKCARRIQSNPVQCLNDNVSVGA